MSSEQTKQAWALGGTIFAATAMIVLGFFQVVVGIAAIANDVLFVEVSNYVYGVDVTFWGWVHLVLGAVMVLVGVALYGMSSWARGIGIALAVLSAVNNFMFMPYYPLWSIIVIALNIFVIWALATVRPQVDTTLSDSSESTGTRARRDSDWPVNRPMPSRDSDIAAEQEAEVRRSAET